MLRRNACNAMNFMSRHTEEGALDSAQMHRGDSVLRWGVTLQGEQRRHTQVQRRREQGSGGERPSTQAGAVRLPEA